MPRNEVTVEEAERSALREAAELMERTRRISRRGRGVLAAVIETGGLGEWERAPRLMRDAAFLCRTCPDRAAREAFGRLLLHVEGHSARLLHQPTPTGGSYLLPLRWLAARWAEWRREAEHWRPRGTRAGEQFAHLTRHLLGPNAERVRLDSAADEHRLCLELLAPRRREHWRSQTLPLTRRTVYYILVAHRSADLIKAYREAQLLAMGGDPSLAAAVTRTRLGRQLWSEPDERWWAGALHWLAAQDWNEPSSAELLIPYMHARRYGEDANPDPGFKLSGRSGKALMRLVRERQAHAAAPSGPVSGYPRSLLSAGAWTLNDESWTVEQIRDSARLREEGLAMRHCVGSYDTRAASGRCSIWSMQRSRKGLRRRAITIEVNASLTIVQCRGRNNRALRREERQILEWWAELNGIPIRL